MWNNKASLSIFTEETFFSHLYIYTYIFKYITNEKKMYLQ